MEANGAASSERTCAERFKRLLVDRAIRIVALQVFAGSTVCICFGVLIFVDMELWVRLSLEASVCGLFTALCVTMSTSIRKSDITLPRVIFCLAIDCAAVGFLLSQFVIVVMLISDGHPYSDANTYPSRCVVLIITIFSGILLCSTQFMLLMRVMFENGGVQKYYNRYRYPNQSRLTSVRVVLRQNENPAGEAVVPAPAPAARQNQRSTVPAA